MKESIGRGLVFFGVALLIAAAVRALADMLQADRFDPWSLVVAAGLILMSIGWGLVRQR